MNLDICESPVFIVGSPRSGTSVLAWSLHQHPDFRTSDETEFLSPLFGHGRTVNEAVAAGTSRPQTWLTREGVTRGEFLAYVGLGLNALFTSRSEGKRWIDQTPGYTPIVDVLSELFPGAKFLHIARDGRAVVHSMLNFAAVRGAGLRDSGGLPNWASTFEDAVRTWARFAAIAVEFCSKSPERAMTVKNEAISVDPAMEFSTMLRFLGAPDHDGPATFFSSSRVNSSFEPLRLHGSVADSAHEHHAKPRLTPESVWSSWSLEQRSLFCDVAGPVMVQLGFAQERELIS